jgi:enoyl-CoA hydratase
MNEYIKSWQQKNVLIIQLIAEHRLNALDAEMMGEIVNLLRAADSSIDIRAIVVTGSGRGFCTGADLKAFCDFSPEYIVNDCTIWGENLFNKLAVMNTPSIAAVNGYAMGGGMELALACDFRIGNEKCVFSAPEYGFGWIPGWGGVHRLTKLVGPCKAKELLLFKKRINSQEALDLGIVSEIISEGNLLEYVIARAQELAELNPLTVGYTKAIVNDFEVPRYDSYMQGFTNGIASKTEFARNAVEDFFHKREEKKNRKG